jgi:hypothetical protein
VFDEDSAHGLGGGVVEVLFAFEAVGAVGDAEVGLVDQGGGGEGVAGALVAHEALGAGSQEVVDEGEELAGGGAISLVDGAERLDDGLFRRCRFDLVHARFADVDVRCRVELSPKNWSGSTNF